MPSVKPRPMHTLHFVTVLSFRACLSASLSLFVAGFGFRKYRTQVAQLISSFPFLHVPVAPQCGQLLAWSTSVVCLRGKSLLLTSCEQISKHGGGGGS